MGLRYKRVLLKLSGGALLGSTADSVIDFSMLDRLAREIVDVKKLGVELVIVIGGGNIWRYRDFKDTAIDRVTSDYMGMLATVMNSVALESALSKFKVSARVCSALALPALCETYIQKKAKRYLDEKITVICAGGTGNPYFTTDSAAALRALELGCEAVLKATDVDYVYDSDPKKNSKASVLKKVTFTEVLEKDLKVMDATAISLCRDGQIPIVVFNLETPGNLVKILQGEKIGTLVGS